MVSRRNLFTITLIMLVLFFMFQFSGAVKESSKNYETNQNATLYTTDLTAADVFDINQTISDGDDYVLYIGQEELATYSMAEQWCTYTKRIWKTCASIEECKVTDSDMPTVILIDPVGQDFSTCEEALMNWVDAGVNLVFLSMPNVDQMKSNEALPKILGIYYMQTERIHLSGVQLYQGFLLGGDVTYQADTKESEAQQDLELDVPWYFLRSGTKVYMKGLLDENLYGQIDSEELPPLIWRNSIDSARIFVVNGSYMQDVTGIGMLDAMMAQTESYELYPVVNAQSIIALNYPVLSEENTQEMQNRYTRSATAVLRDIVWSGVSSVTESQKAKITGMIAPQLDYENARGMDKESLIYYMKLFREAEGEAGLSLSSVSDTSLDDKLDVDERFLLQQLPDYAFTSVYVGEEDAQEVLDRKTQPLLGSVRTLLTDYDSAQPLLSYGDNTTTILSATQDGFSHTFSEDLRLRSIETALGYSNLTVDFSRIIYPQSVEDDWENAYERFSSYTNTYWQPFQNFDATTLTEADERARQLLNLDYADSREDEIITLDVKNLTDTCWFLLRTNGEQIQEIEGASYIELEEGAYLLSVEKDRVVIRLTSADTPYYYNE